MQEAMASVHVDYAQSSKNVITIDLEHMDVTNSHFELRFFGQIVSDPGPKGTNLLATQLFLMRLLASKYMST